MKQSHYIAKMMLPVMVWASIAATPLTTWAQTTTLATAAAKRSAAEASLLKADSVRIDLENKDITDCYGTDRIGLGADQLSAAHRTFMQGDGALSAQNFEGALQLFQSVQVSSENARSLLLNSQRRSDFTALPTKRCSYATAPDMRSTIMVGVETDKAVYYVGEAPRVTITATNLTNTNVSLDLPTPCRVGLSLDWGQIFPGANCSQGTGPVILSPHGSYSWTLYYDKASSLQTHALTAWIYGYGNATTSIQILP